MRLLIVGDMNKQLVVASKMAVEKGAKVFQVSDIKAALLALYSGRGADLIIADIKCDIKKLIMQLEEERIVIPVIACSTNADKDEAVKAIKAGAKDYLSLPPDQEVIAAILESISTSDAKLQLISESKEFKAVIEVANKIAKAEATVLITGDSGTGKEVVAKYIHRNSKRAQNHMVSINCAAIPENLLESELFGYEKGAFTGAVEKRIGKFEEANAGTIFLDEISEMDMRLQAKLLRAIQEREIFRVGGNKPVPLNIRIIATSNRDLGEWIAKGKFREDLYYRLNVINLHLPPLRERKDDVIPLSRFFVERYANLNGVRTKQLSDSAIKMLTEYDWPGNVRELENTIHRALLISDGDEITGKEIILYSTPGFKPKPLAQLEQEAIQNTIRFYGNNLDKAAAILGVNIRVLKDKLNAYKTAN